ncbi:hypothetical protein EON63_03690 [archaeon]|nr:MAG: hypothetical protein EON63_03690 [archaeon]
MGRCVVHLDAFHWVQRDSYLPQVWPYPPHNTPSSPSLYSPPTSFPTSHPHSYPFSPFTPQPTSSLLHPYLPRVTKV